MILSDISIKERCKISNMIENFIPKQVSSEGEKSILSYGLSSYGYDARISNQFKIYKNNLKGSSLIDPKKPNESIIEEVQSDDPIIIEPHGFILGLTVEKFNLPRDVMAICIGKSTYARCGLIVNVTPVEAGCSGQIVIEISNTTHLPVLIYPNEGICQFLFFKGDVPCEVSYEDKKGKYRNQDSVKLPFCALV